MIEFLTNNVVWVVLGVIITIMAIVGYFAENSELGKKVMKPKKKESKPKTPKKQEKPQSFEDAIGQIDKNATLVDAINNDTSGQEKIMEDGIAEEIVVDDAWSNNVDTNDEQAQDVVETNPDEWLNAPINLQEDSEKLTSDNVETQTTDYLYDLPEVSIEELPENGHFDSIEVLDVSDEFEDIEVLNVPEQNGEDVEKEELLEINPVEDTLIQFDNSMDEAYQSDEVNETHENTGEINNVWK